MSNTIKLRKQHLLETLMDFCFWIYLWKFLGPFFNDKY